MLRALEFEMQRRTRVMRTVQCDRSAVILNASCVIIRDYFGKLHFRALSVPHDCRDANRQGTLAQQVRCVSTDESVLVTRHFIPAASWTSRGWESDVAVEGEMRTLNLDWRPGAGGRRWSQRHRRGGIEPETRRED